MLKAKTAKTGMEEEQNVYEKIYNAPLKIDKIKGLSSIENLYEEKPLLIALVFTRCTGICSPFILQLKEQLEFKAIADSFQILVLSFDPKDSKEDMQLMAKRFGLEKNSNWIFAITDSIERLNQSVSFTLIWDSARNHFDHDALLIGINREGFITKKLIGIRKGHDLDLLIASVNNVFSPTFRLPTKNSLFSCFNYDPQTGQNKPGLGLLFIALPAFITVCILILIKLVVRKSVS